MGEVRGHHTFHGLGRLDELGDGAGHALGVDGQLLLQVVGGLLDDLRPRGQTRSRPLRVLHPPDDTAGHTVCCSHFLINT